MANNICRATGKENCIREFLLSKGIQHAAVYFQLFWFTSVHLVYY